MILKPYYEIISCLDDMHEANTSLVQLHQDGFFFFSLLINTLYA